MTKKYIKQCFRRTPRQTFLSPWRKAKKNLFNLLGRKLIISKEILISKDISMLEEEIIPLLTKHGIFDAFFRESTDYSRVLSLGDLAKNEYTRGPFLLNSGTRIQNGMKSTKAIAKVAKEIGFTIPEDFFKEYSQILNQKKISGKLCLSIHPLDFLTMSDNASNWTSCLSLLDEGCFSETTTSLMNSPMVLLAYLEGSKPMQLKYGEWNNKKWRQAFVVNNDIAVGMKAYPYESEELEIIILQWIKELSAIKFSEPKTFLNTESCLATEKDRSFANMITVNCAYNCFDLKPRMCITSDTFIDGSTIFYGGPFSCLSCGDTFLDDDFFCGRDKCNGE